MKLTGVLASAALVALLVSTVRAEDLRSTRTQIGRGGASKFTYDRNALIDNQKYFDLELYQQTHPTDISAADAQTLDQALRDIRRLMSAGLNSNTQMQQGNRNNPPLTADEQRVLGMFNVPGNDATTSRHFDYKDVVDGVIGTNTHRDTYYAFDIDKVLNHEYVIHNGEPSVYAVDVEIPVKLIKFERQVSTQQDSGLTGGWSPGTSTTAPHYRIPIDQWAVKADGDIAIDPVNGRQVPLQMVGHGNWFGWTADPNFYTYNESTGRFRVAMALSDPTGSPDLFPAGGHIHCGFIYDMANPINCHGVARSGDPSNAQTNDGYGTTVVLAVDNSGNDN